MKPTFLRVSHNPVTKLHLPCRTIRSSPPARRSAWPDATLILSTTSLLIFGLFKGTQWIAQNTKREILAATPNCVNQLRSRLALVNLEIAKWPEHVHLPVLAAECKAILDRYASNAPGMDYGAQANFLRFNSLTGQVGIVDLQLAILKGLDDRKSSLPASLYGETVADLRHYTFVQHNESAINYSVTQNLLTQRLMRLKDRNP